MGQQQGQADEARRHVAGPHAAQDQHDQGDDDQHREAHVVLADLEGRERRGLIEHGRGEGRQALPRHVAHEGVGRPPRQHHQEGGNPSRHDDQQALGPEGSEGGEEIGIGIGQSDGAVAAEQGLVPGRDIAVAQPVREMPEPRQEVVHAVRIADEDRAPAEMRPEPPCDKRAEGKERGHVHAGPAQRPRNGGIRAPRRAGCHRPARCESAHHPLQLGDRALDRHRRGGLVAAISRTPKAMILAHLSRLAIRSSLKSIFAACTDRRSSLKPRCDGLCPIGMEHRADLSDGQPNFSGAANATVRRNPPVNGHEWRFRVIDDMALIGRARAAAGAGRIPEGADRRKGRAPSAISRRTCAG